MKVFINPGHAPAGNPDPGAVGNGYRECDIALELSHRVMGYLTAVGIECEFMQNDSLEEIVCAANESGADLFVSIHMNAYANPNANGTEVWSSGSHVSNTLAKCIQNQLIRTMGTVDRGVKVGNLYVTKYTDMPAVLVEAGFITNPSDCYFIVNNYDKVAAAIARGVTDLTVE